MTSRPNNPDWYTNPARRDYSATLERAQLTSFAKTSSGKIKTFRPHEQTWTEQCGSAVAASLLNRHWNIMPQ